MSDFQHSVRTITRSDKNVLLILVIVELALGYGMFLLYPVLAGIIFGAKNPVYDHANRIARAMSPLVILLFNIVIYISNMDTRETSRLNRVNRFLGITSGIYFGCYALFLLILELATSAI